MKSYLVIGLGKFGKAIAKTLYENSNIVLAIDKNEEEVQKVIDDAIVEEALIIDVTDENALKKIAKDAFDTAFVCIGSNIQDSVLVTLTLKELGINQIICKAETKTHGKVLEKLGATQIVYPEELIGEKIAYSVMHPSIVEYFKFSDDYSIVEIKVPKEFINKSLIDIKLRNKYQINLIALKDKNNKMNITPSPDYKFQEEDILILLGNTESIGVWINEKI